MILTRFFVLLGLLFPLGEPARAAEPLAGPYMAAVEKVVDGDTIAVRVTVWLDLDIRVLVRIRGIDAPELKGACAYEKAQAQRATAALARLVGDGTVLLTAVEGDKYFGRVLADVTAPDGSDVAAALIAAGMARRYEGGRRGDWCAIGGLEGPAAKTLARAGPQ